MKKFLICFFLLVSSVNLYASDQTIFESVVKVHGDAWGTGNCINEDERYLYFTTNKHVVGNSAYADLHFYRNGYQSNPIKGEIFWYAFRRNEPIDIALIRVPKESLGGWKPTIINFNPTDELSKVGDTVITIGCPEAGWPRAYKGHIVNIGDGVYRFTPTVIPGQSGSLLMNADGTKAIGLIAWYEGNYGKAMNLQVIKKAVLGESSGYYLDQPYKFDDYYAAIPVGFLGRNQNGCGPFGCERPRIFSNRQRPPRGPYTQPQNPWENNENPQQNPDDPNGGIKLFPTYPGEEGDDFVPPKDPNTNPSPTTPPQTPPQDNPKIGDLERRIGVLESDSKKNVLEHVEINKRITNVDIKVDQLTATVKNLDDNLKSFSSSINEKLKNLETKVDQQKEIDVVTPGKLEDYLKESETLNTILTGQEQIKNSTSESFKNISDIFNTNVGDLKEKVEDIVGNQSDITDLTKIFIASTQKEPESNNMYYDFGQTAVAAGIPSSVLLVLLYFARKMFKEYIENLKNRFGGAVSDDPFYQAQSQPITIQP